MMRNMRGGPAGTVCLAVLAASALLAGAAARAQDRGLTVTPAAGASLPTGEYRLLVIGIDEYARLPRLNTAVADAKAITQVLQERYGFSDERTTSLFNTDATASNILRTLRDLAKQLTPNDSLLIYYAGHGHVDEITQTGSWLPVGADPKDPATWIDNSKIKAYVRAMKARHVFLISDSCFSGDFFRSSRAALPEITDAYVRKAFAKTSREAITSGGIEPVSDAGFANHSVFAHFLLKALRESTEAYLLPAAIHERVKGGVAANARQQTQHGILAGTGGEVGGAFVLFLKGTGGAARLDSLIEEKKRQMSRLAEREAEAKAAAEAQAAVLGEKERRLAALEAKIEALKKGLGAEGGAGGGSAFDEMVAMVQQKEKQKKELAEMRRKAEEERKAREAEIARLRQEERNKKQDALDADLAKYREIVSSEFGRAMKAQAWDAILTKWGLGAGSVPVGDTGKLSAKLGLLAPALTLDLGGGVLMELVLIPAGEFTMGSPDSEADRSDNEGPQHRVSITRPFYMGKYEVTCGQFGRFISETRHRTDAEKEGWSYVYSGGRWSRKNGASWRDLGFSQDDDHPVANVSWNDAKAFCDWLSRKTGRTVRLPTEAQWEYASRAGSTTVFHYGNSLSSTQANFDGNHPYGGRAGTYRQKTTSVGSFRPNAWGLHDMHGNLWEWCSDWYDSGYYAKSPGQDPSGPTSGGGRVLRGGSWNSASWVCRSAYRHGHAASHRRTLTYGFRVAVVAAPGR